MVKTVAHIGICVNSIDDTLEQWIPAFNAVIVKEKRKFPGQISCLIEVGGALIELMEPDGDGVVKKYLETHGEGLHHLSFQVDDFDGDCARFEQCGMSLIRFPGNNAFIKPKGNHGLLCEVNLGNME